jgi:uncharacterized small protein (DUF1192 family)
MFQVSSLATFGSGGTRVIAMSWDDLEPKTKKPQVVDLGPMSIEDLTVRIGEFETEIARMKAAIADKQKQRDAAAAFFKPKP